MSEVTSYLSKIKKKLEQKDATEHTHRSALESFLEAAGRGIVATNEAKRIACGSPDFQITRNGVPLGYVETKDIGTNLDEIERGKGSHAEQFKRYNSALPNWILTDYLQFRWFVKGEKRLTAIIAEQTGKFTIKAVPDAEPKILELLTAFYENPALTVDTAKELAKLLAAKSHIIRTLIIATFNQERAKRMAS